MRDVLLSLDIGLIKKVLSGEVSVIVRKTVPRKIFNKVVVCSKGRSPKVYGHFYIKEVPCLLVDDLWEYTKGKLSMDKDEFYKFLKGETVCYAFVIDEVVGLEDPCNLSEMLPEMPLFSFDFIYLN